MRGTIIAIIVILAALILGVGAAWAASSVAQRVMVNHGARQSQNLPFFQRGGNGQNNPYWNNPGVPRRRMMPWRFGPGNQQPGMPPYPGRTPRWFGPGSQNPAPTPTAPTPAPPAATPTPGPTTFQ